jgi:hypothetical protein
VLYFEKRAYPSTATRHRLLGTKRWKEAFSRMDLDRALNCNAKKKQNDKNDFNRSTKMLKSSQCTTNFK